MKYTASPTPIDNIISQVKKKPSVHCQMKSNSKWNPSTIQQIRGNMMRAERLALQGNFRILSTNKGNAIVTNTEAYTSKPIALLEDPAYKKLAKDPTQITEQRTAAIIKRLSLPEEVAKHLQPYGLRSPRIYGLPKTHKKGTSSPETHHPTYNLIKHLVGLLGSCLGNSLHYDGKCRLYLHAQHSPSQA